MTALSLKTFFLSLREIICQESMKLPIPLHRTCCNEQFGQSAHEHKTDGRNGLKKIYLYFGIFLFKEPTNTRNGSTSSDACYKYIHLASCIFPDFWTSCVIVYLHIEHNNSHIYISLYQSQHATKTRSPGQSIILIIQSYLHNYRNSIGLKNFSEKSLKFEYILTNP
jgi:hypothetical protein